MHETDNKIYLATELLIGGSLIKLINHNIEKGRKFKDNEASLIIKGILNAVAYLHSYDIAHRDIKPGNYIIHIFAYFIENIMFAKVSDFSSLKLIDFGLSAKYNIQQNIPLSDKCGTAIYMAPEVFENNQYSKVYFVFFDFI